MAINVLSGVDRLDLMDKAFKGKRLAVVTGGGAVDRNLNQALDVLTERYQVVRLFNTIYGVRGDFRYGEDIPHYVDEKTVEVTLKEGDTDFLAYFTTAIIPKNNANPDTNPIGTGPYKYVSRSPQENFIVEKFDEYWGEAAHIENVVFKVCANADSIVMELQGGGIDMFCRLTSAQVDQLGDEYEIYEGTMNLVQAMYLNNAVKPFDNELVREALCYAVDPQEIMEFMADGKGTELGSSMFPAFGKYYMPELNDVYNVDYDKAKEAIGVMQDMRGSK